MTCADAFAGSLDQVLRPSTQGARQADFHISNKPAEACIVKPLALNRDASLVLGQPTAAAYALRDRDLI